MDKRIGDDTIGYKKVGWFMMTMKGRKLKKQVNTPASIRMALRGREEKRWGTIFLKKGYYVKLWSTTHAQAKSSDIVSPSGERPIESRAFWVSDRSMAASFNGLNQIGEKGKQNPSPYRAIKTSKEDVKTQRFIIKQVITTR